MFSRITVNKFRIGQQFSKNGTLNYIVHQHISPISYDMSGCLDGALVNIRNS